MDNGEKIRSLNLRQKVLLVLTDLSILGELCYAMYCANLNPEEFTPVFMKSFFCLFLPTLVSALAAGFVIRTKSRDCVIANQNQTG